jgi:death-on-curing protein
MKPVWVPKEIVLAMHERLLAEHRGASGLPDGGMLDSTLARPRQLVAYNQPDLYDLATAYVGGILRNHPFVDGNKRTAFMTAYVFLARNGLQLTAPEVEAVQLVTALAANEVEETEFAGWLRDNCESL